MLCKKDRLWLPAMITMIPMMCWSMDLVICKHRLWQLPHVKFTLYLGVDKLLVLHRFISKSYTLNAIRNYNEILWIHTVLFLQGFFSFWPVVTAFALWDLCPWVPVKKSSYIHTLKLGQTGGLFRIAVCSLNPAFSYGDYGWRNEYASEMVEFICHTFFILNWELQDEQSFRK